MFLGGCIVAGIGTIFLFLGIIFWVIGKNTWKCTETVTGKIVDMCYNAYDYNCGGTGRVNIGVKVGGSSAGSRCPIFSYVVNGIEYKRASNVAWNIGHIKRKMKQPQTIYYNPLNPRQASLIKQSILSIIGKVFIPIGFGMLILVLVLIIFGK